MFISCGSSGIVVSVTNETGGVISDLHIAFAGGEKHKPILGLSETFKVKVQPKSESGLSLEFTDGSGKKHQCLVDVYFEPSYKGTVSVRIGPDGEVKWKDQIKVY